MADQPTPPKRYTGKCPSCEKEFDYTEEDMDERHVVFKSFLPGVSRPAPRIYVQCPHCDSYLEVQR